MLKHIPSLPTGVQGLWQGPQDDHSDISQSPGQARNRSSVNWKNPKTCTLNTKIRSFKTENSLAIRTTLPRYEQKYWNGGCAIIKLVTDLFVWDGIISAVAVVELFPFTVLTHQLVLPGSPATRPRLQRKRNNFNYFTWKITWRMSWGWDKKTKRDLGPNAVCENDARTLQWPRWMKSTQFCFTDEIVQWWPVGKYIFKHKQITNTIDSEIILHNYILY